MDEFDIFMIIILVFRIITGFQLVLIGKRKNQENFVYLYSYVFIQALTILFGTNFLLNQFLFDFFIMVSLYPYVIFINKTFYVNKKSVKKEFLIIYSIVFALNSLLIFSIGIGIINSPVFLRLNDILAGLNYVIASLWCIFSIQKIMGTLRDDKTLESWVKTRYKLLVLVGYQWLFSGLKRIIFGDSLALDFFTLLVVITHIITILLEYLIWVMPNWFKRFLNRKSLYIPDDFGKIDSKVDRANIPISNEDLESIINKEKYITRDFKSIIAFFAEMLSPLSGIELIFCKGILRLSIQEVHPDIDMNFLTYVQLKEIFSTSLRERLERLHVEDLDNIIKDMLNFLTNNQSLFTIVLS